jgi:hypothetical protein
VLHECGACPLPDRYVFIRPFFLMKRRSLLDAVALELL